MYVATVPNRGSPPAILLRESYREDGRVKTRTLKNLSDWPAERIALLRAVLRGDQPVAAREGVAIEQALPHGHVVAALGTGRPTPGRPGPQGGPRPRSRSGERKPRAGYRARSRPGRGQRGLRRARLARAAARPDRSRPGAPSPRHRHPGAVRPDLDLSGRPLLPTGPVRLQPRPPQRQAADRLWRVVH